MKSALALLLLTLAATLALTASPAYAQIELTEVNPADGAELETPPDVVHLCFSEPVDIQHNNAFEFSYQMPAGRRLGLRIVFQADGECVDVHAGLPAERPAGEYTFEWQVTALEGDEEGSGTLRFEVTTSSGAPASLSPTPAETTPTVTLSPTPAEGTPAATPSPAEATPAATPSPEEGAETEDAGDDDGPDILFLALITIGSVGGAAVLFTMGYLLRRRLRYEPHRPPEDEGGGGGH